MNTKFVFCHRIPNRTLRFRGRYFPVCARCTGIYLGALFTILPHYFIKDSHFSILTDYKYLVLISFILMVPTLIDGTTQLLRWRKSNNFIRVVTGLSCGIGYGLILIYW